MTDLNTLIIEQLQGIRRDIGEIEQGVHDLRADMLSLREQQHGLQGSLLRHEKTLISLSQKIEPVKSHPVLRDEE